jgi:tetratricopeptide (TPR) repeat protein
MTQNNLGIAYANLAKLEDTAANCKRAILAYETALEVRTLERFPLQYAQTQNNLGSAYATLAAVEDKAANCRKAFGAYEMALARIIQCAAKVRDAMGGRFHPDNWR